MINLEKAGDAVNLSKEAPNSTAFNVGLNWNGGTDVDTSLFALDANDTLIPGGELSFKQMSAFNRSMFLDKDDRGGGQTFNGVPRENARVILSDLPANVKKVVFGAWVYSAGKTFGMVPDCTMSIIDISGSPTSVYPGTPPYKEVIAKGVPVSNFKLSGHLKDRSVALGAFERQADNTWSYVIIDKGFIGGMTSLEDYFKSGMKEKGGLLGNLKNKLFG